MTYERRLTDRVLANWSALTEEKRLPRLAEITADIFGNDWPNCALVQLDQNFAQSRFLYLGSEVPLPKFTVKARVLADIEKGALLRNVANAASAMVSSPFPITLDGAYAEGDHVRLYRSIVLPISEDNSVVDHVLIAISHREVPLEKRSGGAATEVGWKNGQNVGPTSNSRRPFLF